MRRKNSMAFPSPWAEFLQELDALLPDKVALHCIGGFVASLCYSLPRPTGDIDYFSIMPMHCANALQALAGEGSALARKHKIRLHYVTVNTLPEDYAERLVEMFPGEFKKLRLYAPDPYDLILSKLERNSPKDRDDVEYLARTCDLRPEILRERYETEMRPNLIGNEARADLTLKLWLESFFPAAPAS